jgi:hypothetical protein
VTPGWLRRWRETVHQWGFDQALAREYFSESVQRLVLLDTCVDPGARTELEAFAAFVDRPTQVVEAGLDYFELFVGNVVMASRLRAQDESARVQLADADRKLGDYAMMQDLIARMTHMKSEKQVIDSILELFAMLLAPALLVYIPILDGHPGKARYSPPSAEVDDALVRRLLDLQADSGWLESEDGFIMRVGESGEQAGLLAARGVAFPQYRHHYLNLAFSLSRVCWLSVRNARAYEQLAAKIAELQEALAKIRTLSGLLPICAGCKKIRDDKGYWNQIELYISKHSDARFTHGLCPDCIAKYYPGFVPER